MDMTLIGKYLKNKCNQEELDIVLSWLCDSASAADVKSVLCRVWMDLHASSAFKYLIQLVENGGIDMKYIDRSVRNVLRVKFRLGLFENPYVWAPHTKMVNNSDEQMYIRDNKSSVSTPVLEFYGN